MLYIQCSRSAGFTKAITWFIPKSVDHFVDVITFTVVYVFQSVRMRTLDLKETTW